MSSSSSLVINPMPISGAVDRIKNVAARYRIICSGIDCHLLPALEYQPSFFAIAIVIFVPSITSPVPSSVVYATHPQASVPASPLNLYLIAANRPQELKHAMRNVADHPGLPWTTYRFCMTISVSAFMRFAMFSAIKTLPILFWYSFGTSELFA